MKNITFSPRLWIFALALLSVLGLSESRVFENLELLTYDLRFRLRPAQELSPHMVIINIDDQTISALGQWPLPRDYHASLVDVLKEAGARTIIFDLLFSEKSEYDSIFSESIKNAGNVYLPFVHDLSEIVPELKDHAKGVGHINVEVDNDGKIRKVPLFVELHNGIFPQIAIEAAGDWLRGNFLKLNIPLDENGMFLVNYPGGWKNSFHHISYFDVLKSYSNLKEGKPPRMDLSMLKDKICFIGLTATGTSDLRATPLENVYPMLGLQASVFNSILTQKFIRDVGRHLNATINLFVFIFSLIMCRKLSARGSVLGITVLALVYLGSAIVLFNEWGFWVDLFLPLFIMTAMLIASIGWRFWDEYKKRQILENELKIASAIQKSFLPQNSEEIPGLSIACFFEPAKYVAGDLYDIVKLDDCRIGVFIGDVSGKGASAALVMAQAISLFRVLVKEKGEADQLLIKLNKELCGRLGGRFVTALYVIINIEKNNFAVSSAGQGPMYLYRARDGKVVDLSLEGNIPLGLMQGVSYQAVNFQIEEKDRLIIFSDGLFEARNRQGREFGLETIKKIICQNAGNASAKVLESVQTAVKEFSSGCEQHDDITLIVITM